jgi:hypothetical protein
MAYWIPWSNNYVFRTGGTDRLFTLASGAAAVALRGQGLEVTKTVGTTTVFMGFNKGLSTVTAFPFASTAHIGEILLSGENLKTYRITGATNGLSYTISPVYDGSTATLPAIVFPGPSTGSPAINPPSAIIGRDQDQVLKLSVTLEGAASITATLTVV